MSRSGFTLIELLIVVAIIAILAAIAVPNFLEAQVRSKVSRVKNELRTLATGLESYKVDGTKYPPSAWDTEDPPDWDLGHCSKTALWRLSTPIAYITNSALRDPFVSDPADNWDIEGYYYAACEYAGSSEAWWWGAEDYNPDIRAAGFNNATMWELQGAGPDRRIGPYSHEDFPGALHIEVYDATNGTMSWGDIARFGP